MPPIARHRQGRTQKNAQSSSSQQRVSRSAMGHTRHFERAAGTSACALTPGITASQRDGSETVPILAALYVGAR